MYLFGQIVILVSAGLFNAFLLYLPLPVTAFQQIVLIEIVISLLIWHFLKQPSLPILRLKQLLLLFLMTSLTTLLVLATGGLYSQFLIVLYLFTIGLSLLVSFYIALVFMGIAIILITEQIFINPILNDLIKQDPSTALLYLISFITIIPLVQLVARRYHLSEKFAQILTIENKLNRSIFEELNAMIIIVNSELIVTSLNKVAETILEQQSQGLIGKSVLEIIDLRDQNGQAITPKELLLPQTLKSKIISGLYLYPKNSSFPKQVNLKVEWTSTSPDQPQLYLIFQEIHSSATNTQHQLLNLAEDKLKTKESQLVNNLSGADRQNLQLIEKINHDVNLLKEIEDHSFNLTLKIVNIILICNQVIEDKQSLSDDLRVKLFYQLANEPEQRAYLNLQQSLVSAPNENNLNGLYIVTSDEVWLAKLLGALIDMAILVSYNTPNAQAYLSVDENTEMVMIRLTTSAKALPINNHNNLYQAYYPTIEQTNLKMGSGLEGIIAKTIATHLNLEIMTINNEHEPFGFLLKLSKQVQKI